VTLVTHGHPRVDPDGSPPVAPSSSDRRRSPPVLLQEHPVSAHLSVRPPLLNPDSFLLHAQRPDRGRRLVLTLHLLDRRVAACHQPHRWRQGPRRGRRPREGEHPRPMTLLLVANFCYVCLNCVLNTWIQILVQMFSTSHAVQFCFFLVRKLHTTKLDLEVKWEFVTWIIKCHHCIRGDRGERRRHLRVKAYPGKYVFITSMTSGPCAVRVPTRL
jgi:hypothetical protein